MEPIPLTHVYLIGLGYLSVVEGLQLGSRRCVHDGLQGGVPEVLGTPRQEGLEITLGGPKQARIGSPAQVREADTRFQLHL